MVLLSGPGILGAGVPTKTSLESSMPVKKFNQLFKQKALCADVYVLLRPNVLTFTCESPPLDHHKHKRDWNNPFLSALNTDCVTGCNQSGYPEATVEERLQIWSDHKQYYLSLLHFYKSDPAVPADVRATVNKWGLCADEFGGSSDHWPPQLYVRETRRMVGDRVFTQNTPVTENHAGIVSIGCGDYMFDSHPAQRFACRSGTDPRCIGAKPPWLEPGQVETRSFAWSEGNVQQASKPYPIPFWVITPRRDELSNLPVHHTRYPRSPFQNGANMSKSIIKRVNTPILFMIP